MLIMCSGHCQVLQTPVSPCGSRNGFCPKCQGKDWQPGPIPPLQAGAEQWEHWGQLQPRTSGISLGMEVGQVMGPWLGLAWQSPWPGMAGLWWNWTLVLLRHRWDGDWWRWGDDMESWAMGRVGKPQERSGRGSQACQGSDSSLLRTISLWTLTEPHIEATNFTGTVAVGDCWATS